MLATIPVVLTVFSTDGKIFDAENVRPAVAMNSSASASAARRILRPGAIIGNTHPRRHRARGPRRRCAPRGSENKRARRRRRARAAPTSPRRLKDPEDLRTAGDTPDVAIVGVVAQRVA